MQRITPVHIYIIGQIKGLPIEVAKANFDFFERNLRKLGFDPVNPFKIGIPEHWDYPESRPHNLAAIEKCEAVFIQSNWRKSEGSMDEIKQSMLQGKELYYAESKGMEMLEEQSRYLFEREVD